jgi:hypothetical protein
MALTKIKSTGIADDAVTAGKIAAGAVVADITTGSVTATHLAGSIPLSKTNLTAGTGISLATDTVAVSSSLGHVTTVGTIGTGVWQGTAINQTYLVGQSGTNTGDQTLPTDFVSAASGGTFGGNVTISGSDGSLYINDTTGTAYSYRLVTGSSADTTFEIQNATGGGTPLKILANHNATFAGNVVTESSSIRLTGWSTKNISWGSADTGHSSNNTGARIEGVVHATSGQAHGALKFYTNSGDSEKHALTLEESGNATFAGDMYINKANPTIFLNSASAQQANSGRIVFSEHASGTNDYFEIYHDGSANELVIESYEKDDILKFDRSSGNATFAGDIQSRNITATRSDGSELKLYLNNNNTTSGDTKVILRTAGATSGDAYLQFDTGGSSFWHAGVDTTDDSYSIGYSYYSSANPSAGTKALNLDSSNNATFGGAVIQGGTGFNLTGSVGRLKINGTSGGDNYIYIGNYNDNGWGYLESINNANGLYFAAPAFRFDTGNITPYTDNEIDLGDSGNRYDDIYATNTTIQSSDERMKDNIKESSLGLDFISKLNPVQYKWKDYDYIKKGKPHERDKDRTLTKTHKRTHYGLIAQEVEKVITDSGMTTEDFAPICYDKDSDRYSMRYGEYVGILIKAVQELSAEVEKLKENA